MCLICNIFICFIAFNSFVYNLFIKVEWNSYDWDLVAK